MTTKPFAFLGSINFTTATAKNTLHIVTQGGGGILHMDQAIVAELDPNDTTMATAFRIPAATFYVPGDFDGDGKVETSDFNLLSFNFAQPKPAAWMGYQPAAGRDWPDQHSEFNALSFNFSAGPSFGSGGGSGSRSVRATYLNRPAWSSCSRRQVLWA